jgi:peptide-methionine (S)-S-oxide reductase
MRQVLTTTRSTDAECAASTNKPQHCSGDEGVDCLLNSDTTISDRTPRRRVACAGDIVTIDLTLTPENGLVPEPLFDRNGILSFVVGRGYLPALHELVLNNMGVGDQVKNVSVDAGWGERNEDLVMELPKSKLKRFLNPTDGSLPCIGSVLQLQGGIQLTVIKVNEEEETLVVDANAPLAGASYDCSLTILSIDDAPLDFSGGGKPQPQQQLTPTYYSRYKVSTWALGCFWGGELAFMRVPGVVGTRVGYTQGIVRNPTYEDVCTGKTRHREAIMVVYDADAVSYEQLMKVALERLAATNIPNNNKNNNHSPLLLDDDDGDDTMFGDLFAEEEDHKGVNQQYHHGFYFHSDEQREIAEQELTRNGNLYNVELKEAAAFYDAEEYHQQYLLKGGQSARKGAKETIRCYG